MSLYWQPSLYYQQKDGKFIPVNPTGGTNIYWKADKAAEEPLTDMPGGLRIIAGDPTRNVQDDSDLEHQAVGFKCFCQGVPGSTCNDAGVPARSHDFETVKKYNCDIIRIETEFPNCWNGIDTDT